MNGLLAISKGIIPPRGVRIGQLATYCPALLLRAGWQVSNGCVWRMQLTGLSSITIQVPPTEPRLTWREIGDRFDDGQTQLTKTRFVITATGWLSLKWYQLIVVRATDQLDRS